MADDGAQQAGLADAVAAEDAGDLARLGAQRDAPQRLRRAVVEVDASTISFRALPRPRPGAGGWSRAVGDGIGATAMRVSAQRPR